MTRVVTAVAVSLVAFVLMAGPAPAAPDTDPVRFWSVSKVEQGFGVVPVQRGAQMGDRLSKEVPLGRLVFNLPLTSPYWESLPRDRAFGSLFSSADGARYSVLAQAPTPNPIRLGAPKGAVTHLDEYQAYEKRARDATLRVTISGVLLQTVDDNADLAAWECPATGNCEPIRTVVRFHARAYAASAGGDFFDAGGVAYLEGHQHSWRPGAATSADAPGPLWGQKQFFVDGDADDSGTGAQAVMDLEKPRSLKVPLAAVRQGELFAVHVSLDAEAVNDRGGESAAQAFIQDPQHKGPGLLTARGLKRRGRPRFKEPRVNPPPAARCRTESRRHAGTMQLSSSRFAGEEASGAPMVLVTRTRGSRGAATVTVFTRGGSARAGRDFKSATTRVTFGDGDTSPRFVEIPILEDHTAERPEKFTVSLSHPRCGGLGAQRSAAVTIFDDPQPPPASSRSPRFTLGGAVGGLEGSGLVLQNLGAEVPISANGRFALPGKIAIGQSYDVRVKTQPHTPDQVCTVTHGAGQVNRANVTDIVVHCETIVRSSGLDATFGSDGLVSTPVGVGQGEAVVIQPRGGIVTAGWRTVSGSTDFALTRHDSSGGLDRSFGTNGIVTTDLGGHDDQALDAALLPDGGIVAVGETDAAGIQKQDFAIVRYRPDGTPDVGFGSGGIVKKDFFGNGDVANAVAVQPDGKILVAGFAVRPSSIDSDFALVRYNADGTLDPTFGTGGVVPTDIGTKSDDARGLVIEPGGRIVLAGTAGDDVALARYTSDGKLDGTFGHGGSTITDFGSDDAANGVALTSRGEVLIAGYTLGPRVNRDFLLARYTAAGALDSAFGTGGFVRTDVGAGDDFAENMTVQPDGRIVLVGRASSPTILDMALVRYNADGTLDTGFDSDGILTADFHGSGEFGQHIALDSSGRIVAAGYTANGSDTEFALMRANP